MPAGLPSFGGPLNYNLGDPTSTPFDPRLLNQGFDPNSAWSIPQGSQWLWQGSDVDSGSRGFWNVDTTPQGGVNPGNWFDNHFDPIAIGAFAALTGGAGAAGLGGEAGAAAGAGGAAGAADAGLAGLGMDAGVDAASTAAMGGTPYGAVAGGAGGAAGAGGLGAGLSMPSLSQVTNSAALARMLGVGGGGGAAPGGAGGGAGAAGAPGGAPGGDLSWLANLVGGGAGLAGLLGPNPSNPGLNPQQQALINAGQQTFDTAQDPQQALYGRTQQQLQDQVRASDSARGVAMSPYSAGVENKAMSDFNIDWNNAQLGRQVQGLGAMSQANNAATNVGNAGLQNRQFGAGQNSANLNALLTAIRGGSGGSGAGLGGILSGLGGAASGAGSWLANLFGGGAQPGLGGGVDQFGQPIGGGSPTFSTNPSTGDLGGNIDPNTGFPMMTAGGSAAGSPGFNDFTGGFDAMSIGSPSQAGFGYLTGGAPSGVWGGMPANGMYHAS